MLPEGLRPLFVVTDRSGRRGPVGKTPCPLHRSGQPGGDTAVHVQRQRQVRPLTG
ncbi:hypothetical protein APASM_5355 [Actinosynnema pretiosum subsp. pretiosum]|nr:hypothetical protein APASM_5355 [Actinosynnema pretiosum subsp. pretiosum]